jgi:hypothetical protein
MRSTIKGAAALCAAAVGVAAVGVAAVGTAAPAIADPGVLSGHYVATMTAPNQLVTEDWQITPCGDGCASIVVSEGTVTSTLQAHLAGGQWTMDTPSDDLTCPDGSVAHDVLTNRYSIDADTLVGTIAMIQNGPGCGRPTGWRQTDGITLRLA